MLPGTLALVPGLRPPAAGVQESTTPARACRRLGTSFAVFLSHCAAQPPLLLCSFSHRNAASEVPTEKQEPDPLFTVTPWTVTSILRRSPREVKTFGRYSSPAFLTFPKVPCLFPSPFLPSVLVAKPTKPVVFHFLLGADWASGPRRRISLHVEDEGCNLSGFQL